VTLTIGLALVLFGAFDKSSSGTLRLLAVGLGVVIIFIGTALVAPKFVPVLASVLGWPAQRFGGAAGALARENAMRNPARTASTAAALMIGLALVTAVGVLAQGLKSTFEQSVDKQFHADYALTSENGFTPTGVASEQAARNVPGVEEVSGVRAGQARVLGHNTGITGVPPNVGRVINVTWQEGGPQVPRGLGSDGAFTDSDYAKKHKLTVGSPVDVLTPAGERLHLKIEGVFKQPKGGSPFGTLSISTALFDRAYQNPQNVYAFILIRGGVTDANTAKLSSALASFPDAKVQTEKEFKKQQESGINILLNLLYVLLSLSIVVSLFGIVNTLVLTVFERTREVGMLRAVGMTRRQTRRMIRHESIVTALIGAALGIPLGVGLALLVSQAIGFFAFAIPWGTLVVFVVAAIVVGFLAAIFPARRASRLNVLEALQYE
jgi:putative ABC transport system permease protein